jgi:stage II sporulation protein P
MPVVKSTAINEDDLAEYKFSVKENMLKLLGIDTSNPLSIISRELNFLKIDGVQSTEDENNTPFSINPFKIKDSDIIANQEPAVSQGDSGTTPAVSTQVYNASLKKTLNPAKPEVLIYHTHTTETYSPYTDDEFNTFDEKKNIVAVGDVITSDLEKNYGIAAIHDRTVHNTLFNESYARSGKTLDTYLNKYKDFKLIIDLHRDSISDREMMTANLNSTSLARFMFVVGPGNPNKSKNIAVAKKLSSISQTIFPGLIRPGNGADYGIYYHNKGTKFNQHKNGNIVLMELGAPANTVDEAKSTALYISRIIAEYVNGK